MSTEESKEIEVIADDKSGADDFINQVKGKIQEFVADEVKTADSSDYVERLLKELKDKPKEDLNDYERFVVSEGSKYESEFLLKKGYDRYWKYQHNLSITDEEFYEESKAQGSLLTQGSLHAIYEKLQKLVEQNCLDKRIFYIFAHQIKCTDPDDIAVYKTNVGYVINTVYTKLPVVDALIAINKQWGFEVGQIKLIGQSYLENDDTAQFVRFDCRGHKWLWSNGSLLKVDSSESDAEG